MLAVFAVVSIEQFFAMRGAKHSHSGTFEEVDYGGDDYESTDMVGSHMNGHMRLNEIHATSTDTPTMEDLAAKQSRFKDNNDDDHIFCGTEG